MRMGRLQELLHAEIAAPIGWMRSDGSKARTPGMVGADGQRDFNRFTANITGRWDTNQNAHQLLRCEIGNLPARLLAVANTILIGFSGKPLTAAYARTRARWEPLYEVTQIKGDGETHKFLSPNDEFADYETWDRGNLNLSVDKDPKMLQYEYARRALMIGMQDRPNFAISGPPHAISMPPFFQVQCNGWPCSTVHFLHFLDSLHAAILEFYLAATRARRFWLWVGRSFRGHSDSRSTNEVAYVTAPFYPIEHANARFPAGFFSGNTRHPELSRPSGRK